MTVKTTQRWIRWPAGTHNHTRTEGRNGPIVFGGTTTPSSGPRTCGRRTSV